MGDETEALIEFLFKKYPNEMKGANENLLSEVFRRLPKRLRDDGLSLIEVVPSVRKIDKRKSTIDESFSIRYKCNLLGHESFVRLKSYKGVCSTCKAMGIYDHDTLTPVNFNIIEDKLGLRIKDSKNNDYWIFAKLVKGVQKKLYALKVPFVELIETTTEKPETENGLF